MRAISERQRRFASAYARLANATKAAIEAGYSQKAASSTGYELLRNPQVVALIESSRVRRDVHADQTYQQLIAIANASMKVANDALNDPGCDRKEKIGCLEGARRAVETVARCEGLMVEIPSRPDEGRLTLQNLAQKLKKGIELVREEKKTIREPGEAAMSPASAVVEVREVDAALPASAPGPIEAIPQLGSNGNGHAA